MAVNISAPIPPQNFKLLSSETLAAPAATFTSVTIPSGYKFIMMYITAQQSASANTAFYMTFNADGGANYNYQQLTGTAAAVASAQAAAQTAANICSVTTGTNTFQIFVTIANGATLTKSYQANGGTYDRVSCYSGYWNSAAAITAIVVGNNSNNFVTGSQLLVYGVN
jgi:hypothetical protein